MSAKEQFNMIGNCEVKTTPLADGGAHLVVTGATYVATVSVSKEDVDRSRQAYGATPHPFMTAAQMKVSEKRRAVLRDRAIRDPLNGYDSWTETKGG